MKSVSPNQAEAFSRAADWAKPKNAVAAIEGKNH
jgi:hypothetical protein